MAGVETFLGLSFITVALLAVFWRYSALPEIDWNWIVSGTMFLLSGWSLNLLTDLETLIPGTGAIIGILATIASLIGGLLILIGAIKNAINFLQSK